MMSESPLDFCVRVTEERVFTEYGRRTVIDARAELAALRARVAELEAAQAATLTPRKCGTCQSAAEQMREDAAKFADDFDGEDLGFDVPTSIGAGIRALPLPTCGDCNPLAPDVKVVYCREFKPQSQAALHDQLNELIELANMNGLYDAADFVAERRK